MSLLDAFFASPNHVTPASDDLGKGLALRALSDPEAPTLILPWDDHRRGLRWYVMVGDDQLEQVREELLAHVGISYTDFFGQNFFIDEGDPGDIQVSEVIGSRRILRIDLLDSGAKERVTHAFERFLDMWERRPPPPAPPARAAAEILREYRLAILGLDRQTAEAAITELREAGSLEIVNTQFLELEVLATFDGPTAVLGHPSLHSLLSIRRPARVSDLLARAIDQVHLRPQPTTMLPEVAARFSELDFLLQGLITSPGECRSPSGVLMLGLRAQTNDEDAPVLVDLATRTVDVDEDTLQLLRQLPGNPSGSLVSEVALGELLLTGSYDEVLQRAKVLAPNFESVNAALQAAQWLDSIEAANSAIEIFDGAPDEVRERFAEHRQFAPIVQNLRSLTGAEQTTTLVEDWNGFFEALEAGQPWPEAVETAQHGAVEWPVTGIANDPAKISQLADYVSRGADLPGSTFHRSLPYLIEWIARGDEGSRRSLREVYEALVGHLALYDTSRAGLDLLATIAGDVIAGGVDASSYDFLLSNLEERWSSSRAPSTLGWAADIIELAIDNPCPDTNRRVGFVSRILGEAAESFSRGVSTSVGLLHQLAGEVGLDSLVPLSVDREEVAQERRDVSGVTVALYSLTEPALRRAKTYLMATWPGLNVVTRADHVGSNELSAAARSADLFVVAVRSAKHAATEFIKAKRGQGLPTKNAAGKGSASLIAEVDAWLSAS